jgi:hypothetical protein
MARHENVCQENPAKKKAAKKRGKLDMTAKRLGEVANEAISAAKKADAQGANKRKPRRRDWREESAAVRAVAGTAPSGPPPRDTRSKCPTCGRMFDEAALDRHMVICARMASKRR